MALGVGIALQLITSSALFCRSSYKIFKCLSDREVVRIMFTVKLAPSSMVSMQKHCFVSVCLININNLNWA